MSRWFGSVREDRKPAGLLSITYTGRSTCTGRPSTRTASAGATVVANALTMAWPLIVTRPAVMIASHARREPSPAEAR